MHNSISIYLSPLVVSFIPQKKNNRSLLRILWGAFPERHVSLQVKKNKKRFLRVIKMLTFWWWTLSCQKRGFGDSVRFRLENSGLFLFLWEALAGFSSYICFENHTHVEKGLGAIGLEIFGFRIVQRLPSVTFKPRVNHLSTGSGTDSFVAFQVKCT